jgi:PmbA protein
MIEQIVAALRARQDLQDWSIRHITTRGAQLYAVPTAIEAIREVATERYILDVLHQRSGRGGAPAVGSGNATLVPGDEIGPAIDAAMLMAGLVHNPPYGMPGAAPLPDIPNTDPALTEDAGGTLRVLLDRLRAAVATHEAVKLTAAELYGETRTTHLVNSRGVDATDTATRLDAEWVLLSRIKDREVESFVETTWRRVADLDIEAEVARRARYAADTLQATPPPTYSGPVVLRDAVLAEFLNGGVLRTQTSGAAKFSKISRAEIGRSIFRSDVVGDSFTLYANRQLPFGTNTSRFDDEGHPAQRIELVRDNVLVAFTANQRYADYLGIPATGAFGNIELPAGTMPAAELLVAPHVEIASFSWFNPDPITGEFACEIRLGYVVADGRRTPFKGGTLVGNVLDALANVRWSAETDFYGDYQGPTTAHFAHLQVAGTTE